MSAPILTNHSTIVYYIVVLDGVAPIKQGNTPKQVSGQAKTDLALEQPLA